jgi:cysteine synthase A
MLLKAEELARTHGYFLCRQFDNEANADVHSRTTAREIVDDFSGDRLDYWVTGFGTGGTLKGVARVLKSEFPGIRIVAAEPDNSPMLASGIPQLRDADGSVAQSHPNFRPHLMQGWAPDFISSLTQGAVDQQLIDEIVPVAGQDALDYARALACREGMLCGTSSGATLAAAVQVARGAPRGSNIVCMLPDTGERYLSTPLFEHIGEAMTDDELALSGSTPSCQFGVPQPAPQAAGPNSRQPQPQSRSQPQPQSQPQPESQPQTIAIDLDPEVRRFVDDTIGTEPVVMFALQWCEFCWSVRKLFARLGIEYRSVDLDSVEYQDNDSGGRIRSVLAERTGARTIPQVFVAGTHIGGCTETFDGFKDGSLRRHMDSHGITYNRRVEIDPYGLLPKWLQPRKSA